MPSGPPYVYATPTDLWTLSAPPIALFADPRMCPGTWTVPVHASGTGTGSITIAANSNPRDTYTAQVRVSTTGEVNVPGYENRVGLPQVQVSLDGGTTWSQPLTPDANAQIDVLAAPVPASFSATGLPSTGGGFVLQLTNATLGSPVAFGTGSAQVTVTAKIAGLTIAFTASPVASTPTITSVYTSSLGTIVVYLATNSGGTAISTAAQVTAYLLGSGLPVTASGSGGGTVVSVSATALPLQSFVANDLWTFSTQASPDVVMALQAETDWASSFIRGSYNGANQVPTDPLLSWGSALVAVVCDLARWRIIRRLGQEKNKDFSVYEPTRADYWLKQVQTGQVLPTMTEEGPPRAFPLLIVPIDPLSPRAGSFPI